MPPGWMMEKIRKRVGGVRVGITTGDALLIWPSDVRAYANRVGRAIEALNADILDWAATKGTVKDYGKLGDKRIVVVKLPNAGDRSFYQSWDEWYGDWIHNKIDIDNDSMLLPTAVITRWEEIERRETDYRKWRKTFIERGGVSTGAEIATEAEVAKEHKSGTGIPWTTIFWIVGLGVGAYGLSILAPVIIPLFKGAGSVVGRALPGKSA